MKIRAYLALIAIAILAPVIIFSAFSLSLLLESERKAAIGSMHETARTLAISVDRELTGADATLRMLSTSSNLARGDLEAFYRRAQIAGKGPDRWTVLSDEQGRQLLNTLVPYGTPLPAESSSARTAKVLQDDATHVSNVLPGPASGSLVATLAIPVNTVSGSRYVLSTVFITDYFKRLVSQVDCPPDWIVAVIDREGRFVARSHNAEQFIGRPAREALVKAGAHANEGELRQHTLEGVDSYQVFTHSAMAGWMIAVAAPVDVLEAPARRAVTLSTLGLLAAVLCAISTAALFARRITASIERASHAAIALARGETPTPALPDVAELRGLHLALDKAGAILEEERGSRKKAEAEREKLLHGEQEARRVAEAQNQAKDKFLAMLGHEIRNPLAAINGAIAIIHRLPPGSDKFNHAAGILERQSKHLAVIVDDLLDVSRVTSGKIVLAHETCDLAAIVQACIDGLRASGKFDGHALTLDLRPAWVTGDFTRLEQIVNNLLGNAIKYTPPNGAISVSLVAENESAVLTVRDSGIGIPDELLPRVFDLFVQGSEALDRAQGGLGIGLTLVRQLVTMHGGEVTASSDGVGLGSTFTVRLRRCAQPSVLPSADSGDGAAPQHSILLIEDNEDARSVMAMVLRTMGHTVHEARNGPQGLQVLLAQKPDIAIIDIGLPGLSGMDIARVLRRDAGTRHIALIALTGYGQDADRERAIEAGFDLHMVKPVDIDALMDAMRKLSKR